MTHSFARFVLTLNLNISVNLGRTKVGPGSFDAKFNANFKITLISGPKSRRCGGIAYFVSLGIFPCYMATRGYKGVITPF